MTPRQAAGDVRTDTAEPGPCDDAWNRLHRLEKPMQRADRNFAELLQEIRVLLTGVQILLGFLLAPALSTNLRSLDPFQHVTYLIALLCAAIASALLVAPIATHRALFRRGRKPEVVGTGHRMVQLALIGLGGTICSGLLLVLDITVGRAEALTITTALGVGITILWVGLPMRLRRPGGRYG
jgi:hypothetical protein